MNIGGSKTRIVMPLVALALLTTQASSAAQMTAADLISFCNASDDLSESACRFYILGVTEGSSLAAGMAADKEHFCIPEGVTAVEMKLIFQRVIREDIRKFPNDLQLPAVSVVGAVMMREFPCRRSN